VKFSSRKSNCKGADSNGQLVIDAATQWVGGKRGGLLEQQRRANQLVASVRQRFR